MMIVIEVGHTVVRDPVVTDELVLVIVLTKKDKIIKWY